MIDSCANEGKCHRERRNQYEITAAGCKRECSAWADKRKGSGCRSRAADAAWLKAYTAKDLDKAVAFCDEQGSMLMPNTPIATGKDAIAKLIASHFAMHYSKLTWHPNSVGVARSGELGYTSGTYELRFQDATGKTITDKGKYLIVWKKHPDSTWKVLFDMSNSDLPPASPL